MYCIGDKIVYPMHGAGTIEAIEEKEILGQNRQYYILKMPCDDMKVMIPTDNNEEIGLRDVITKKEIDEVIEYFAQYNEDITANWNRRYRENVVKMRSGNIYDVVQVVKTLMLRDKARGVSSGERKMLVSARQILVSEIILVQNRRKDDIEVLLAQIVEEQISITLLENL